MKLLKFFLAVVIMLFAYTPDATSDPPDLNQGIEITLDQNTNAINVDMFAYANLSVVWKEINQSQLIGSIDIKAIKLATDKHEWNTYCYMSRHRRTKSQSVTSIQTKRRDAYLKGPPLIRGKDC